MKQWVERERRDKSERSGVKWYLFSISQYSHIVLLPWAERDSFDIYKKYITKNGHTTSAKVLLKQQKFLDLIKIRNLILPNFFSSKIRFNSAAVSSKTHQQLEL